MFGLTGEWIFLAATYLIIGVGLLPVFIAVWSESQARNDYFEEQLASAGYVMDD